MRPQRLNVNGWISTNSQKLFQLNANGYHTTFSNNPKTGYGFSIAPRYRFNNQFSLRYQLNFNKTKNDQGYVDEVDNNIIFGIRDRKNYTNTNYTSENVNFNNWNLDLNYIWQFAPGSQLIAFYRNSIFNNDTNTNLPFFKNLKNLFDQTQKHTLSVRIVYFIDYNKIKKILDAAS